MDIQLGSQGTALTIRHDQQLVMALIFITVDPEQQRAALDLDRQDTETALKFSPGMVAAAFHRRLDGHRIAEIVQWESHAQLEAATKTPAFRRHLVDIQAKTVDEQFSTYELEYLDTAGPVPGGGGVMVSPDETVLTIIITFRLNAEQLPHLIALLIGYHETALRGLPGFVSSSYLASQDGEKVVEYLQFESLKAFEAVRDDPGRKDQGERIARLVHSSEVEFYRVDSVSRGAGLLSPATRGLS